MAAVAFLTIALVVFSAEAEGAAMGRQRNLFALDVFQEGATAPIFCVVFVAHVAVFALGC